MTLPANTRDWPEDWRERYEERAAIMEYEGGLSRAVAERLAEVAVRLQARSPYEYVWTDDEDATIGP